MAAPEAPAPTPAAVVRPPPAPVPKAPAVADQAQVQRAFEAVQDAYADGGTAGLARANADCAAALKSDPRVLDYCLAFDLFATAVAPQIARADPEAARLEAARAALPPGADPAARVATVKTLMRMESLGGTAPAAPGPPRRMALNAHSGHGKHHPSLQSAEDRRREAARAAVRALFARAEATQEAAKPAAAFESPGAEEAPH